MINRTLYIFSLHLLLASCDAGTEAKLHQQAIQEASIILDQISQVDGIAVSISNDSLMVHAKDSFALFDPHFCEEVTWWLAYTILRKYNTIGTVYYDWEFKNNDGERTAYFFVHRENGLDMVRSRYSNEAYYQTLRELFRELKFRQYIILGYDLYGSVLANDTSLEARTTIYNENIFNPFSDYSNACSGGLQHQQAETVLQQVDQFAKKLGKDDGGYSSAIIRKVLVTCEERL